MIADRVQAVAVAARKIAVAAKKVAVAAKKVAVAVRRAGGPVEMTVGHAKREGVRAKKIEASGAASAMIAMNQDGAAATAVRAWTTEAPVGMTAVRAPISDACTVLRADSMVAANKAPLPVVAVAKVATGVPAMIAVQAVSMIVTSGRVVAPVAAPAVVRRMTSEVAREMDPAMKPDATVAADRPKVCVEVVMTAHGAVLKVARDANRVARGWRMTAPAPSSIAADPETVHFLLEARVVTAPRVARTARTSVGQRVGPLVPGSTTTPTGKVLPRLFATRSVHPATTATEAGKTGLLVTTWVPK